MRSSPCWLLFLASSVISLALQGPALWAQLSNRSDIVQLENLKSRVPAGWVQEKPNAGDYKQYRLQPVDDDKEYAQVTIRFLGKEERGTAAAQVNRWKAMFLPPEGKRMREVARFRQIKINGVATTWLDVRGDYKGIPGEPTTPRANFRLLGVYLNTPKGSYTIRLFGPADTVAFYRKQFEDWIKAFE